MTSKEILQHIKNAPSFKGGDSRYMSTLNSAFLYDQDIDTIEKDLEVLEIFKKYITIFEDPNTVEKFRYVYTSSYLTKEEYDLLKEWLENDYR